jgi:hypothetical protein
METNNQEGLFRWADQIPSPLWDDLRARSPEDAAESVGAHLENGIFRIPLLGFTYQVNPEQYRIIRERDSSHRVGYQTGIVLLTTLASSKGVPPSGRMVTPLELTGGATFFTGAHTLATKPLEKAFGDNPEMLTRRAQALGGEEVSGADCAVRIPGLPFLPLYVLLWTKDDEFSARALIGIDDRALFHLDLAGVFALTNVMVGRLV